MLLTTTYKPSKVMFHFLADMLDVSLCCSLPCCLLPHTVLCQCAGSPCSTVHCHGT